MDKGNQGFIAIAFVVDSSVSLALEWPTLSQFYVMPMLRRLQDTNANANFRAAFITYGTQNSPIVCKNFFFDITVVLKEAIKSGMGQSSCGGEMGMAALEGFVAAIELFDQFAEDIQAKNAPQPLASHIFHFAAANPDQLEHPQCNTSPALDSVTWESLPAELKKRSIHLSSISTKPRLPKFSELHASSSTSPLQPWFITRPQHTVLLAGYTSLQKGVKRSGDPIAPHLTPEPKRPKTSPAQSSSPPKANHSSPPPPPPPPPPRVPSPPRMAAPTAPIPANPVPMPTPGAMSPQNFAQLREMGRVLDNTIRQAEAQINELRARGEHQPAHLLAQQTMQKKAQLEKLRVMMQTIAHHHRAAFMQQTAAAQAALQHQQPTLPPPAQPETAPVPTPPIVPPKQEDIQQKQIAPDHGDTNMVPASEPPSGHVRSLSGGMALNRNLMTNPGAIAQMQKMIEQQERSRQNTMPANPTTRAIWQGPVVWTGTNPMGQPRNIVCHMQAGYGNSPGDPKPETWPKQLTFALAEKPFMTLPEIVNRYKPALCPFSANPNSNLSHNDTAFKSLLAMLITQKTQFTVSWILLGASHPTVNALVYPFKDIGLVGTFFPSTGVPDFPQPQPQDVAGPSSAPPPQPSIPVPPPMTQAQAIQFRNQIQSFLAQQGMPLPAPVVSQFITPPIISSLLKMTKENRSKALIQLAQRWQQQQQHQRLGLGLGVPAGGRLPGQPQMMSDPQQPSEALGFNQFGGGGPMSGGFMSSGGYPDTMTQAGNNGAVSFQMMQNFMQRNQDGGSGGM